ncbi:MAG: hypothetical protein PF551_01720 [Candidatus Marinimicrobia bacterium]|jgi:hypothetical protein|nr:hypothetical protein [Candidatus Neomarinimicrobiota bacterium]
MFLKRYIPLTIVFIVGVTMLASWFIPHSPFDAFEIHATQWFDIIASFAMILGAMNLLKLQSSKLIHRKSGWQYSLAAILGFFLTLTFGFILKGGHFLVLQDVGNNPTAVVNELSQELQIDNGVANIFYAIPETGDGIKIKKQYYTQNKAIEFKNRLETAGAVVEVKEVVWGGHLQENNTYFAWIFKNVFTPLSATMFALLAFFVASASYRAFRVRNLEATILLVAGIIIMIGRVPLGVFITNWIPKTSIFSFLRLEILQEWIYQYPNAAGARAIMIGIGLGIVGTSLRVILGIEKSFLGEK